MRQKRSIALILTFIVMSTLTLITTSFLYTNYIQTRRGGLELNSEKAFWLAEAGREKAIYELKNNSQYRNNPTPLSETVGDGSFYVEVNKGADNTYSLSSTGTVRGLNRKITQSLKIIEGFPYAFDYALFGNTNPARLKIEGKVSIVGDVYYDGDVEIKKNASVTGGLVYADSVSGDGTYTAASQPPSPLPTYPSFDTSWYDSLIATAETEATGDWTLGGKVNYNLNGNTVYYNKVRIRGNATVSGSGIIVATDNVTIEGNANLSSQITIITKRRLEIKNNATIEDDSVLYADEGITLRGNTNVEGSILVPATGKKVQIEEKATFTGVIYADRINLQDNAVVKGSIVVNRYDKNKIADAVKVTYNSSFLPSSLPEGFTPQVRVKLNKDWNEVSP